MAAQQIRRKKIQNQFIKEIGRNKTSYSMALPGMIFLILFCYIPYYYLVVAFKDFNLMEGVLGSPWVGLENFKFFFPQGGRHMKPREILFL